MKVTQAVTDIDRIPTIDHDEAMLLAETEFARTLDLLRVLGPDDTTSARSDGPGLAPPAGCAGTLAMTCSAAPLSITGATSSSV